MTSQSSNGVKYTKFVPILAIVFLAAGCNNSQSTTSNSSNNNQSTSSNGSVKTAYCNNFPSPYSQTKPSNFPSDVPIYTGAQFVGALGQGVQAVVYYCTTDNLDLVKSFYQNNHSSWTIKQSQSSSDSESLFLTNSANNQVVLNISKSGAMNGSTIMMYSYSSK